MKKTVGFVLVLLSALVLAASAVELQSLTVDGNYWFGAAEGIVFLEGPADYTHNSANAAVSARFSPGFVLGADYTYGKLSNPSQEGEEISIPAGVGYTYQQQLLGIYVGYPYMLAPGFDVTASAGLGYYANTQKVWDIEEPQDKFSYTIKSIKPQVGLAAQYKVTPQFSLRGNFGIFLGTGGTITLDGGIGYDTTDSEIVDISLKLFRWQLEGKYLIKPGLEATAGYRVWDVTASPPENEEEDSLALDSKGLYFGVRYSF